MIKVLFLANDSAGATRQADDAEVRAIDATAHRAGLGNRLEFVSQRPTRFDDLSGILRRERPHILHFSGHGAPAGKTLFIANNGKPNPVAAEMLAQLLGALNDTIRVVVLDARYSEDWAKVMVKEVRWAVGMRQDIGEEAAITFASEFYREVALGRSVQDAFDLGVNRLTDTGVADAKGLVRLHKRRGVDPSESVLDEAGPSDYQAGLAIEKARGSRRFETSQPVRRLQENRVRRRASGDREPPVTEVADDKFPAVGTREWGLMNRCRAALIRKKNREALTADENAELERLQRLLFAALEQSAPGPIIDDDGLRRLREGL